jgi:hypothetical protein
VPPLTIEAYYEGDRLFPRASRGELGGAIRSVLKRFPSNNDYAKATLPEIVGADRLAAASRFPVSQLRSGVFLSQPDGTYRFEPLPRIAQIAPCEGLVAGDFDGDGHADILAAQNAYTFSQAVGRFDGGLGQFLRGDGQGHFTAIPPAESGFVLPGDARALALVDFDGDGWPDFFVTRNSSPSLAWQNRGISGNRTLEVRLKGFPGNPSSIGARVTVQLVDGSTQTSEVAAGGGVMSQSTSNLFFGYPANNLPHSVRVRWPSGQSSEQILSAVPERVVLSDPSR